MDIGMRQKLIAVGRVVTTCACHADNITLTELLLLLLFKFSGMRPCQTERRTSTIDGQNGSVSLKDLDD